MAKKVYEMSQDEKKLYREIEKEIVKANRRIRNLDKLDINEPFAIKQLHDYLGSSYINAITKSGYISLRKDFNLQQLTGIKRATEDFLNSGASTITEIKKLKKEYEQKLGKPLTYKYTDTLYKLENNYTWIYDYIPKSEFWDVYAPLAYEMDSESWFEQLYYRNEDLNDEDLKQDLEALYIYVTKE